MRVLSACSCHSMASGSHPAMMGASWRSGALAGSYTTPDAFRDIRVTSAAMTLPLAGLAVVVSRCLCWARGHCPRRSLGRGPSPLGVPQGCQPPPSMPPVCPSSRLSLVPPGSLVSGAAAGTPRTACRPTAKSWMWPLSRSVLVKVARRFSVVGRPVFPVWHSVLHCTLEPNPLFGLSLQRTDVDPLHFRSVRVLGVHSLALVRCDVWADLGLDLGSAGGGAAFGAWLRSFGMPGWCLFPLRSGPWLGPHRFWRWLGGQLGGVGTLEDAVCRSVPFPGPVHAPHLIGVCLEVVSAAPDNLFLVRGT